MSRSVAPGDGQRIEKGTTQANHREKQLITYDNRNAGVGKESLKTEARQGPGRKLAHATGRRQPCRCPVYPPNRYRQIRRSPVAPRETLKRPFGTNDRLTRFLAVHRSSLAESLDSLLLPTHTHPFFHPSVQVHPGLPCRPSGRGARAGIARARDAIDLLRVSLSSQSRCVGEMSRRFASLRCFLRIRRTEEDRLISKRGAKARFVHRRTFLGIRA